MRYDYIPFIGSTANRENGSSSSSTSLDGMLSLLLFPSTTEAADCRVDVAPDPIIISDSQSVSQNNRIFLTLYRS